MKSAKAAAEKIGLFTSVLNQLRLMLKLMADPRVPTLTKLLPLGAVVYLLSPIDLVPDMIIGLGQLDDLGILVLGIKSFISMAPAHVVAELQAEISGGKASNAHASEETVDASYRVVDDK